MKNKIGTSKSMKKMQKGGTMSSVDSMKYYGNKFDSLSAEAAKKVGSKKDASKDIKGANEARANESRIAKKVYGTGPGIPQKKKGGSVKKYKKGGSVGSSKQQAAIAIAMKASGKKPKMQMGGSLKDVPADKVGLGKLPTAVRNKMGYKKMGGGCGMKMGGSIKSKKK